MDAHDTHCLADKLKQLGYKAAEWFTAKDRVFCYCQKDEIYYLATFAPVGTHWVGEILTSKETFAVPNEGDGYASARGICG